MLNKSVLLLSMFLSGCSVVMSMNGKKDPDLSVIKEGASRSEVEMQLGSPMQVTSKPDGSIAMYEYDIGKEASPGRAAAYGVADVLTLGLFEIIGTPIEASKGTKYYVAVTYDKNDRVVKFGR